MNKNLNKLGVLFVAALVLGTGFGIYALPRTEDANASNRDFTLAAADVPDAMVYENELDVFGAYATWASSKNKKSNDTLAQFIYELKGPVTKIENSGQSTTYNTYTLLDVNGDGLTDMIYRDGTDLGGTNGRLKMAMWLNNGNNSFDLAYKCYVWNDPANPDRDSWYGDCAE